MVVKRLVVSIITYLILGSSSNLFAQYTNNQWYFGYNSGLDFNTTPPTVLTNGALSNWEGSSCISDNNGQILFYTNGQTVYNRNHVPMTNGTGLISNRSSTSSAIIVPLPCSKTKFYIFHVLANENTTPGLYYSVVDLDDNGNNTIDPSDLGRVSFWEKNIYLADVRERMAVTLHSNQKDFWIIAPLVTTGFKRFLLTSTGLDNSFSDLPTTVPVTSQGYLKFSPNGKTLAVAMPYLPNGETYLYDFNTTTGVLTNFRVLNTMAGVYGLEFSPNNRYLYYGSVLGGSIEQYDLQTNLKSSIGTVTGTELFFNTGSFQLAPDQVIYITMNNGRYLHAIRNPNNAGVACDFVSDYIDFGASNKLGLGLPTTVLNLQSYGSFTAATTLLNTCVNTCLGAIHLQDSSSLFKVHWLDLPSDSSWSRKELCEGNYKYWISSNSDTVCFSAPDTIRVTIAAHPEIQLNVLISDSILCKNTCTGALKLETQNPNAIQNYWMNSSITTSTPSNLCAGTYSIVVEDTNFCRDTQQLILKDGYEPQLNLNLPAVCEGEAVTISLDSSNYKDLLWSNGSTSYTTSYTIGTGFLEAKDSLGCLVKDTFTISKSPLDSCLQPCILELYNIITPNNDGLNDAFAPLLNCESLQFYHLEIYNRWGNLVYESHQPKPWGGADLSEGVYFYTLEYSDIKQKNSTHKGSITVLK